MRYRCRMFESFVLDSRRLVLVRDSKPGKVEVANGFEWKEYDEGCAFAISDGIERADDFVQVIMNEAWEKGMRPIGFTDIRNETAALRDHLKDMRTVAFHKLGIKGEPR